MYVAHSHSEMERSGIERAWRNELTEKRVVKKVEERHMARIAGVDLPRDKRIEIGLTYIYGIGRTSSNRILAEAGVNPDTRVRDLTSEEVKKISAVIDETQVVEGDLRRENPAEHQETERNRLLPWNPSQKRTSGTRTEDQDKCKNMQRSEENCS